jgi:hypothetical protein
MGNGTWDPRTYAATTGAHIAAGTTFGWSTRMRTATPRRDWRAHEALDPRRVAGPRSALAGQPVRESRDSLEHPTSVPIAVLFDDTGSMGQIPVVLQTKLAELFGLLLRKGYVSDPQILIGAYGDAECDAVPLQVSQFESDNRIDEALDDLLLEGGGGGNGGESAALAWYYLAHHTATDAWDRRGRKGYAFTVGDEVPLDVTADQVRACIGTDAEGVLTPAQIAAAASERWHLFHLVIANATAAGQQSVRVYTELLGEHAVVLEDPAAVCETIALLVGLHEGAIDLEEGLSDLRDLGTDSGAVHAVGRALATVGPRDVVVSTALDVTGGSGVSRL